MLILPSHLEMCQSGRMGLTRNQVYAQAYRGFESLHFRFMILPVSNESAFFLLWIVYYM